MAQAAVVMSVPIHANLLAGGFHHFVDRELDEIICAAGRSVTDGVTQNDGAAPLRMAVE